MRLQLELGEHRLPVESREDVVRPHREQVVPHVRILSVLQEMLEHKLLVEGGRDLRLENRVSVLHEGIAVLGVPRVH